VTLNPPGLSLGTEVCLSPGRENKVSRLAGIKVGKGEWKGGRSTDNGSSGCVLRSVAWAHELVVRGRPWDDTSQVCAHSVETICLKGAIRLNNKISGITLEPLGKGVVAWLLACQVFLLQDFISKGILGRSSTTSTSGARRNEEEDVGNGKASNGHGGRADEDQVHEVSTLLVDVVFTLCGGHAHGSDGGAAMLNIYAGRGEGSRGADESGGKEREELHG